MQEFKGTRGPWFSDNTRAIGPISTEDDQSYGMIIPVGWVEFDPEIEVQVANQKMMAAAPELLEALQLMLNSQVLPVWHQSIARAAINKALGK
ncbi:hypothetical protein ACYCOH_21395 [Klebsiella pneumoniae]|uniref:hypothetical protein n=1 Tax=Klebsiella pneumoniae TaxID=573 RepID=UPI00101C4790|nr:hypothetical protein [Klebsiella pneumoniae]MCP6337264.1 hypothetical protein [Klebsiella pneumoniae]RYH68263.1 hypothetical protein EVY22_06775 [Klebsiella pneumoniae]VAP34041.1 Uncharacterised protein [Klebsiella pneumoniae]HCD6739233.1 hypothetical protein [Klebsiella pneumoniae]